MALFKSNNPNKPELGTRFDEDGQDDGFLSSPFHPECSSDPRLPLYTQLPQEGNKTIYLLRQELDSLLRWRDANKDYGLSLGGKAVWDLTLSRIETIKDLLY